MGRLRVSFRHRGSVIFILAKDPAEMERLLESVPDLFKKIDDVLERAKIREEEEVDYTGLIRIDEGGGPILKVMEGRTTDKEAIMLLLYPAGDEGLKSGDINMRLGLSGVVAAGYASRLTEMRREGIITRKPTGEHVLTEKGKMMARELVKRLKEAVQE